jgi:hypothetical protein
VGETIAPKGCKCVNNFSYFTKRFLTYSIKGGITHIFIEEFESEEDRNYYLEKDSGHKEFVKSLGELVEKIQIIDFVPGVF